MAGALASLMLSHGRDPRTAFGYVGGQTHCLLVLSSSGGTFGEVHKISSFFHYLGMKRPLSSIPSRLSSDNILGKVAVSCLEESSEQ